MHPINEDVLALNSVQLAPHTACHVTHVKSGLAKSSQHHQIWLCFLIPACHGIEVEHPHNP